MPGSGFLYGMRMDLVLPVLLPNRMGLFSELCDYFRFQKYLPTDVFPDTLPLFP